MQNISGWFFRIAVLYLLAGVTLGIGMAASHNHGMMPVHAHLNLLGWVSMALFGTFYRLWPTAAGSRLARVHFWSFVPAHFVQMVTLALLYTGMASIEPVVAIASVFVVLAVMCFAVIVWRFAATPAPLEGTRATLSPAL